MHACMEGWLVTTSNPPLLLRFGKPRTHHFLVGNRVPWPLVPLGWCPFTPAGFCDQQRRWQHIRPQIHPTPAGCHTPEVTQATGRLTVVQWLELDYHHHKGKPVHPQQGQRKYWNPLTRRVLCILHLPAQLQISCTKLWQHSRWRSTGSSDTLCSRISISSCSNYNPYIQPWEDNEVVLSPLTPRGYRNHSIAAINLNYRDRRTMLWGWH